MSEATLAPSSAEGAAPAPLDATSPHHPDNRDCHLCGQPNTPDPLHIVYSPGNGPDGSHFQQHHHDCGAANYCPACPGVLAANGGSVKGKAGNVLPAEPVGV